jgi:hypothetical protein
MGPPGPAAPDGRMVLGPGACRGGPAGRAGTPGAITRSVRLVDQLAALLRRLASMVPPRPIAVLVPATPSPRRAPAVRKAGRAR